MSARTLTQGAANGRRVSLRPETVLDLGTTCERSYPFADAQPMTWSPKHNHITTGAPAPDTESPPIG